MNPTQVAAGITTRKVERAFVNRKGHASVMAACMFEARKALRATVHQMAYESLPEDTSYDAYCDDDTFRPKLVPDDAEWHEIYIQMQAQLFPPCEVRGCCFNLGDDWRDGVYDVTRKVCRTAKEKYLKEKAAEIMAIYQLIKAGKLNADGSPILALPANGGAK